MQLLCFAVERTVKGVVSFLTRRFVDVFVSSSCPRIFPAAFQEGGRGPRVRTKVVLAYGPTGGPRQVVEDEVGLEVEPPCYSNVPWGKSSECV